MTTSRNPKDVLQNNPYGVPSLQYPNDLGDHGEEPYIIFDIVRSVTNDNESLCVIALNFPASVRTSYSVDYKEPHLGWEKIKAFWNTGTLGDAWDFVKRGGATTLEALGTDLTANMLASWEKEAQKMLNPHMANLFDGVKFRTFSFDFDFMAKNMEESNSIRNIIKKFKYHMHPGVDTDTLSKWLYYPEHFKIALRSPTAKYLFDISRCVLLNLDVDYGAMSNPVFFKKSGAPVNIKLSMTFKETEIITKKRVNEGFDEYAPGSAWSQGA